MDRIRTRTMLTLGVLVGSVVQRFLPTTESTTSSSTSMLILENGTSSSSSIEIDAKESTLVKVNGDEKRCVQKADNENCVDEGVRISVRQPQPQLDNRLDFSWRRKRATMLAIWLLESCADDNQVDGGQTSVLPTSQMNGHSINGLHQLNGKLVDSSSHNLLLNNHHQHKDNQLRLQQLEQFVDSSHNLGGCGPVNVEHHHVKRHLPHQNGGMVQYLHLMNDPEMNGQNGGPKIEEIVDGSSEDNDEEIRSLVTDSPVNGDDRTIQNQCCLLCNSPFNLLLHKRFVCKICALNVCRNCSLFEDPDWICTVCDQQRIISSQVNCQSSWLCKRINSSEDKELIHLVNAKLKLQPNNNGVSSSPADDATSDFFANGTIEDLIAIRSDIELIVVKLLGIDSIDYAHVGLLFEDLQYSKLVDSYSSILASLLTVLQNSIYADQTGKQSNLTVTEACSQLKDLLSHISEKSFEFPSLRTKTCLELRQFIGSRCPSYEHLLANSIVNQIVEVSQSRFLTGSLKSGGSHNNHNHSHNFHHNSHSNGYTTASASDSIVSGQFSPSPLPSASNNTGTSSLQNSKRKLKKKKKKKKKSETSSGLGSLSRRARSSCSGGSFYASNESSASVDDYHHGSIQKSFEMDDDEDDEEDEDEVDSPLNIDEEDEIDDDDEEFDDEDEFDENDEGKNRRRRRRREDYLDEEDDDDDEEDEFEMALDFDKIMVNFPEAGVDLVDSRKFPSVESDLSQDSGIRLVDNSISWQNNWLFKKNKENKLYHQYHLNSDIHYGYMALALYDPVPMLIPNPSQPLFPLIDGQELDAISDLSEHNSETNSIIFSDDDGNGSDEQPEDGEEEGKNDDDETLKEKPAEKLVKTSPVYLETISDEILKKRLLLSPNSARLQRYLAKSKRWSRLKVPDYVPSELRTICNSIPNPHITNLDDIPSLSLKPGNAKIHSGIVAQFCCKAQGLMPLYFAWYKDGNLIACSGDSRAAEEYDSSNRMARIYFGVRFIHRRYVESSCSAYRLLVFNDNECVLELKKSGPNYTGIYSVVAYNNFGHDWADFEVTVDRTHYSAAAILANDSNCLAQRSPRPVRRRPQNKPRNKTNISEILANSQYEANRLQLINSSMPSSSSASRRPLVNQPDANPTKTATNSISQPNVIQQTWHQREAAAQNPNLSHLILGDSSPSLAANLYKINSTVAGVNSPAEYEAQFETIGEMIGDDPELQTGTEEPLNSATNPDQIANGQSASNHSSLTTSIEMQTSAPPNPSTMSIADREHQKWLHPDVELPNNPYSPENIEHRTKMMHSIDSLHSDSNNNENSGENNLKDEKHDEDDEEDGSEQSKLATKRLFNSDRDISRYKRDYYLPNNRPGFEGSQVFSILNTLGNHSSTIANGTGKPQPPSQRTTTNQPQNTSISYNIGQKKPMVVVVQNKPECPKFAIKEEEEEVCDETNFSKQPPLPKSTISDTKVEISCVDNSGSLSTSLEISNQHRRSLDQLDTGELSNNNDNSNSSVNPNIAAVSSSLSKSLDCLDTENIVSSNQAIIDRQAISSSSMETSLETEVDLPAMKVMPNVLKPSTHSTLNNEQKYIAKLPSVRDLVSLFSNSSSSSSSSNSSSNSSTPSIPVTPTLANSPQLIASRNGSIQTAAPYSSSTPATSSVSILSSTAAIHNNHNKTPVSSTTTNNNSSAANRFSAPNNNNKFFSITARSMPREFRERSNKNMSRATNMISLTNDMLGTQVGLIQEQSESSEPNSLNGCSTSSATNSLTKSEQSNGTNGYTNGGSGSGNVSNGNSNGPLASGSVHENESYDPSSYQPIKMRASYWQKRFENGQVTDSTVKEQFPTMDGS